MSQPDPIADLPASVREMAKIIGRDKALLIAGSCQNGRLYVPRNLHADHRLARLIGLPWARKLSDCWGGEIIYLAKCHELKCRYRNEAIRRWSSEGKTRRELADLAGLTERQIDNILNEMKSPPMDGSKPPGKVPKS